MSKFISIDLDPQGIFAVSGTARAGHASVDLALAWDGTDGEPPPALTADTARQIGEQLRDRLKAAGASPSPVLVSIPRDRVILKELRYPAVPLPEEPSVVKFQTMKELTDAPEDVVVDYVPLTSGVAEGERRSMAVAVRKELFAAIQAMCTAGNFKLAAVTPRPYGVSAGLMQSFATGAAPRPEDKGQPVAILTYSPGGAEFTVVRQGATAGASEALFIRTIAPHSLVNESALLVEVRRNLTMYAGANPTQPIQALYVAEPEGRRVNQLKNSLGIPVHGYDPLAGLASTTPPDINRGRFAGAAGLLAARGFDELSINFVTPRQPKAKGDPKQKQIFIAAGVAFLVMMAALAYGRMMVSNRQDQLAELQKQKQDLENDATRLEPDYKRAEAARGWLARRVCWLDMLYDTTAQFHHTDGMVATSYTANAIPPDAKTGKQEVQAKLEIKVTSHSPEPVNALMAAMDADNSGTNKYYLGVDKVTTGSATNDPNTREYSVMARVTGRAPEMFSRSLFFNPPSRKNYPPPVAATVPKDTEPKDGDKDKDKDKEKEPKEKDGKQPRKKVEIMTDALMLDGME